jgi:hypothetical protein
VRALAPEGFHSLVKIVKGLGLERFDQRKTVIIWLAALCLLALPPSNASAQADSAAAKKTTTTGTSATKKPAKTSTTSKSHSSSAAKSTAHSASTKHAASPRSAKSRSSKSSSSRKTVARGQQKIDPQRAQEIQEALIREHYLDGEPAGTWNQASEDALRRYQADHGWQSKTVPDSRALISLGLGPSHDHLLNPESAMTTGPEISHPASLSSSSQPPVSHSPDPGTPSVATPASPTNPTPTPAHDPSDPQN